MTSLSITARTASKIEQTKTQALVALVPQRKTLTPLLKALDKWLGGTITSAMNNGDFSPSPGNHHWLPGSAGIQRVLLVGCGDLGEPNGQLGKKNSRDACPNAY